MWLRHILEFGGLLALALIAAVPLRRQLGEFHRFVRGLSVWRRAVLAMFLAVAIAFGGGKTNDVTGAGGPTNRVGMAGAPRRIAAPAPSDTVTDEEIARGWQWISEGTNAAVSYAMPDGAQYGSSWHVRGAFRDVARLALSPWLFPFGSNELDHVWAFTDGRLRPVLRERGRDIVAVGVPMSAVPGRSRFWTRQTDASALFTWENFFLDRDTNTPVNAQIELLPNGCFAVRSNGFERIARRVESFDPDGDGLPDGFDPRPRHFDGDCHGQGEGWVRANFTNADEIVAAGGYAAWTDAQVGSGLANGLYRLTATFPQEGFRRTLLTVGVKKVVVVEPGEYVFLLEKGEAYEFDIEPFSSAVSFEAVDDIPLFVSPLMLTNVWGWRTGWTIDGGEFVFTVPGFSRPGYCRWMPTFQAMPSVTHLGPGDSPQTFTAVLTDYAYSQSVQYDWSSDDWNVDFSNPHSDETQILIYEMPRWRSSSVTVTATVGSYTLESTCSFTYGENETPQTTLELSAPDALLLNRNIPDSAKIGQVDVSFVPDVETNGTLMLYCITGGDRVRLIGSCSKAVTSGESLSVDIEGIDTSLELDDVTLCAAFVPSGGGDALTAESTLTVVQVNDVILPGAPADGLVISIGTSVALDLAVLPAGADELLSVVYSVRRLRADGTYTDWGYAAGNYWGTDAIYNPSSGGIYQVRAFAGLGWGAEDERYYVWDADENSELGFSRHGERKSFGVVSCQWQKDLRNCAKRYLGSTAYLYEAVLPAQYGFPRYPAGDLAFKCNIFVAHRIVESGLYVPATRGGVNFPGTGGLFRRYPPLANDWASGSYYIQGWEVESSYPEPGYVVAEPGDEIGHVGIMDFDGCGISAGGENVNRKFAAGDPGITKRKFTGGN